MRSVRDEVLLPDIFHTKPEKSDTARFYNLIRFVPSSLSFYGAYFMGGRREQWRASAHCPSCPSEDLTLPRRCAAMDGLWLGPAHGQRTHST